MSSDPLERLAELYDQLDPFDKLRALRSMELVLAKRLEAEPVTLRCVRTCDGLVARVVAGYVIVPPYGIQLAADPNRWGTEMVRGACRKCGATYPFEALVAAAHAARRLNKSTRRMT